MTNLHSRFSFMSSLWSELCTTAESKSLQTLLDENYSMGSILVSLACHDRIHDADDFWLAMPMSLILVTSFSRFQVLFYAPQLKELRLRAGADGG